MPHEPTVGTEAMSAAARPAPAGERQQQWATFARLWREYLQDARWLINTTRGRREYD
jgi:hypothetical protein